MKTKRKGKKEYFKIFVIFSILLCLLLFSGMHCKASSINWNNHIIYEVKSGDNLISIARKFNVPLNNIVELNNIENPNLIRTGKFLIIPVRSREYIVQKGDSLWKIARTFNTTIKKLLAMNRIKSPNLIYPGQTLKVPAGSLGPVMARNENPYHLIWPAKGIISSRFGPRWGEFHEGLDIAAEMGTPIYAASSGRVTFVGSANGYGRLIKIAHRNEITTVYGHCERILVREGQYVRQGQLIALMGNTGRSTGTHLHFEVRVKGQPRDPLKFLPWGYLET